MLKYVVFVQSYRLHRDLIGQIGKQVMRRFETLHSACVSYRVIFLSWDSIPWRGNMATET